MSVAALVGGLTFFVGGVILFVYLRRRRNGQAEAEKGIATVSATTPADNTEPERRIRRGRRRQFLPVAHDRRSGPARRHCDHPQSGMENSFAEEVDPLVEADAYLAHGHDEDAEHILKDAIAKDPTRHELKLALAKAYLGRGEMERALSLLEEVQEDAHSSRHILRL